MSITDELRKWLKSLYTPNSATVKDEGEHIADRIDAEHEKAVRELNNLASACVLLPKDADGEVIHVGDMMERGKTCGRVIALMFSNYPKKWGGGLHWGVQLEGEQAPTALDAFFHHYHEPTVEDVLWDMLDRLDLDPTSHVDAGAVIAEYAQRLQLREVDE